MVRRRRAGRKLLGLFLPVVALLVVGACGWGWWLAATVAHPPRHPYLVTPQKYFIPIKATDEHWQNDDGTQARGWLMRGAEGAPAVIMLHSYGADRSWLLNLGVKINETTNCTVMWPDLRGHGEDPPVSTTTFGTREAADVQAAVAYLRTLKTPQNRPLVGGRIAFYGVELGAYTALRYSAHAPPDERPRTLVLDSVPAAPDALLRAIVAERTGLNNDLLQGLARFGARAYFLGKYTNEPACTLAAALTDTRVLLLTGNDAGYLRDSTDALAQCFPTPSQVQLVDNLPLTGRNTASAPGEQGEAYDRRVIEFFDRNLRAK
jgi:pimeloyl-ACP methyl ester carboxylesterase